jgi:hypothetical protein
VGSAIGSHSITPHFTLTHINGEALAMSAPPGPNKHPNTGLGVQIANIPTPFTLTFQRHQPHTHTAPGAWRIFFDGGCRRLANLAAVGYVILAPKFEEPIATAPPDRDGLTVLAECFQVQVPFQNESDNMECELAAAAAGIFRAMLLESYTLEVYTD